jgi:hypothetical protein
MYRKSKRSRTLVGKGGRITYNSKNNVEKLIDEINARQDLTRAEKITLINDLKAYVDAYHKSKKKLTVNGFFAHYEDDKINRLLTNAGYTAAELADEVGVTEDEVLDLNNWSGGIFMGMWELDFNYTGSLLKHI